MMGVDRFLVRFKSIDTPYYQEARPSFDLRDLVACLWVRDVRNVQDGLVLSLIESEASNRKVAW